jgi:hypothetical protein
MSAQIHRLRSKPERLKIEQAQALHEYLLAYPGLHALPGRALGRVIAALDQVTVSENGWSFVMLSPAQNNSIVGWLAEHSKRPMQAMRLWAKCFTVLRSDTGEIMLTRVELADFLHMHENNVSEIMNELAGIGAIITVREKVAGLRGPGMVKYFMNPTIGTNLGGVARDKAQAAAPALRLVAANPQGDR